MNTFDSNGISAPPRRLLLGNYDPSGKIKDPNFML